VSVDLYERYMDALRRGHMALARGQLADALVAYRAAVGLAPDRSLPHAGVGQVLLREGNVPAALAAFDAALALSPRHEVGLRGRADALARLGRRTDAAEALDRLADVQEVGGRLVDAGDTTRRALELAEQKTRRRRLQDLTRRIRLQASSLGTDEGMADSLRPLGRIDGAELPGDAGADAGDTGHGGAGSIGQQGSGAGPAGEDDQAMVDALAAASVEPRPDPVTVMRRAEAALDRGDVSSARTDYLAAAAGFAADGSFNAALDACYVALAFVPDDAEVHLQLVELYLGLGWDAPAADKLALLGRLTELDGRQDRIRARIVVLAADHFPDDPRLRRMSARVSGQP